MDGALESAESHDALTPKESYLSSSQQSLMNLKQKLITFKMNLCSILNIGKTGMRAGVLV